MNRMYKIIMGLVALVLFTTACEPTESKAPSSIKSDQQVTASQGNIYAQSQPVPVYDYSQIRDNVIAINDAQAQGAQTTSFLFGLDAKAGPIFSCPSVGFQIPTTAQLTNPDQAFTHTRSGGAAWAYTIAQAEPTGVYTGDSTGTYIICVGADGDEIEVSWEGFVSVVRGFACWNDETQRIAIPSVSGSDSCGDAPTTEEIETAVEDADEGEVINSDEDAENSEDE